MQFVRRLVLVSLALAAVGPTHLCADIDIEDFPTRRLIDSATRTFVSGSAIDAPRRQDFTDDRSVVKKPNFHVQLSQRGVAALMSSGFSQEMPISEEILGTQVTGWGHTYVRNTATLVPSPDRVAIHVQVNTHTRSHTIGTQNAATVASMGSTQANAGTVIGLSPSGWTMAPIRTGGHTSSQEIDFHWGRRFGVSIARDEANRNRTRIEAESARRAEGRLHQEFEQQVSEGLGNLQTMFDEQFISPLAMEGLLTSDRVRYSTSRRSLKLSAPVARSDQKTTESDVPDSGTWRDLVITCHESALNNVLQSRLAGRRVQEGDWAGEFQSMIPLPIARNASGNAQDDKPWTIVFSEQQPVTIDFVNRDFSITLRAEEFQLGDQKYPAARVTATYRMSLERRKPEKVATKPVHRFVRDEPLDIVILAGNDGKPLAVRHQVFRSLLRKRFEPFFVERWDVTNSDFAVGANSSLRLEEIDIDRDWLFIYANVDRNAGP